MKSSLYIETSVIGYLVARPSNNRIVAGHQAATQALWDILHTRFEPYISALVVREASCGDIDRAARRMEALRGLPVLAMDEEAEEVAQLLLTRHAVPESCPEDALHSALASVNGMDLIATWNCTHINNPMMKQRMRRVLADVCFCLPEICSPDELLESFDERPDR